MPGTSEAKSLTEFATQRTSHHSGKSWMENLPPEVLQQCIDGWRAGMRQTVIVEWLKSIGYKDASGGRVAWLGKNAESV